jgi:hypothetical protein
LSCSRVGGGGGVSCVGGGVGGVSGVGGDICCDGGVGGVGGVGGDICCDGGGGGGISIFVFSFNIVFNTGNNLCNGSIVFIFSG